ncbi:MAG TPA: outer membrane lipoprotein carrier protein LolA [Candidatus Cybelea sp.]|nr:outer membrane lipoprotein carrier protein LolA [Candidatus Cybelea sp.]
MPHLGFSRRALLIGAGTLLLTTQFGTAPRIAWAKQAKPAVLTDADKADVARIEQYLNGITTMQAKFQQYSANQGIVFGEIYVRRPGFLRVQYDPPSQVILVADSIAISYYDAELNQLNQAPLSSSPLWFLLRDHVELGGDVTVTSFERGPNAFRIGLVQTDNPDAGTVTLILGDHPLELQQWTIVDQKGQEVRVGLFNAEFGMKLDNELFRTPEKSSHKPRSSG